MSGIVSTPSSTKGDLSSAVNNPAPSNKQPTKTGFDHLDVNRLFKGKTAEPTTKLVAQKHGMQTLGKVLPARRAGGGPSLTVSTSEGSVESGGDERKTSQEVPVTSTFQDPSQGWTNQQPPPQLHPQISYHPNQIQPLVDQKWNGGRAGGNFPESRFAQDFPSLDAAVGDTGKVQNTGPTHPHRPQMKSQDNQYGPGPILRPQTEGSWTLGGSGGKRPSPPNQQQNFPLERPPPLGSVGPLPGQMPIGQIPPPLGAYHPTFRPNQQPNIQYGKGSGGGFYPGGPNPPPRFGMPIPHDAPPPHGGEAPVPPAPLRRGQAPPPRPTSHFTSKPIIRQEELERMDEIGTQDGDWASTNDDVDYNKKINFSDEEEHTTKRTPPPQSGPVTGEKKPVITERERPPPRFLEREEDRDRGGRQQQQQQLRDSEDDWRPRRGDNKDKEREHMRRARDDDWRSGPPSRPFADDFRNKKGPVQNQSQQRDTRPPQDFSNTVPPRFLRRQINQTHTQPGAGQRESPSPNTTNGAKEPAQPAYKILERKRGESESSRDSKDSKDKRPIPDVTSSRLSERDTKDDFRKRDSIPAQVHNKAQESEKNEKKITSSWAEEMDEDESLNAISELRKPHLKEVSPVLKKEERRDRIESKRIIKQTKVADMQTIVKEEPPKSTSGIKESNTQSIIPAQVQQKGPSSELPTEVPKGKPVSVWGDVEKSPPKMDEVKVKVEPSVVPEPVQKKAPEVKEPLVVGEKALKDVSGEPKDVGSNEKMVAERDEADEKRVKVPPQRKNSRESKHPNHPLPKQDSAGDSVKDEGKRPQQHHQPPTPTQNKSQSLENNTHHKEQREHRGSAGSGDGKKEDKRGAQPPQKHPHKPQPDTKHVTTKVEEPKAKTNVSEEGRRQGSAWTDNKQQRRSAPRQHHKDEEEPKDTTSKSDGSKRNEGDSGGDFRRGNKSPSANKRNAPAHSHHGSGGRGAAQASSRLQGYGPPSDRSPFSSNTNKDPEEERKDKKDGSSHATRLVIPPPTSGPVPLMALGEISPPDLPLRNRHGHHDYGRQPPPRFQRGFPAPPQRGERDRERPHKQSQQSNNNLRSSGGKGGGSSRKGDADSEQETNSRWSKSTPKHPQTDESSSKGPGISSETESKDLLIQSPPSSVQPSEPLAELGKVPTMVFENTKLKMSDNSQSQQQQSSGKSLPPLLHSQQTLKSDDRSFSPGIGMEKNQGMDQGLDLSGGQGPLPFPKEPSPVKLDFGTGFGEGGGEPKGGTLYGHQTSRPYSHVQDEFRSGRRISPLQTDLPEGLRSLWDTPPLAQDSSQGGPVDPSSLATNFGHESEAGLNYGRQGGEKDQGPPYHLGPSPMQRNMGGGMGQPQGTNGFQSSPAPVSVIAKPVSSGSPTGLNRQQQQQHAQIKTLQQQQQQLSQLSLESQQQQQQTHAPISFSPFGYGMPQGANAFGPIGGVPSPPSIYGQKSTQLYQQFNHHDNAHVLSGGGRTHSQYGNYANVGGGAGGYGSLYLQPFDNFGSYATHSGPPPQPPPSLQLQSNNRISPGLPPTSASGHALPSPGMMNSSPAAPGSNAFKTVQVRNPTSHAHPSLIHQSNQQPFSQLTHHLPHPHLTPIGPQKTGYTQQPLQPQTQPQLYIPFEANPQSLMSLGANYGGLRSGGHPPPSGTPPMQGLSSSYYAPGTGVNQGYPQQNPQGGGSLQGMQVPPSNPHYSIQFQPQYNSQVQGPAPNVLGNSLTRTQHGNRK